MFIKNRKKILIINLFKIRKIVATFSPLYISICAALLVDLKSNIGSDCASILYILGLFFIIIACCISSELYNRCIHHDKVYEFKYGEYFGKNGIKPEKDKIYGNCEGDFNKIIRSIQYYGVFIFGILGLVCVIFSYISQKEMTENFENQNIVSQQQIDSLETLNIEQTNESILE